MGALFLSLAAISAVLIAVLVMIIHLAVKRGRQQKWREDRAEILRKEAELSEILEKKRNMEQRALNRRPESPYAGSMDILKKKYDSVRRILKIPPDAILVWRKVDIFCMRRVDILHYCWCSNVNLHFFPKWKSVEASLVAGGVTRYRAGDENRLSSVTIARKSIEQWMVLPDGKVGILYSRKRGRKVIMRLEGTVLPVLQKNLPEKEHSYVMKHVYPRSPQNIFDIKGEYNQLKESYEKGGVTEEEFAEGKTRIILTM